MKFGGRAAVGGRIGQLRRRDSAEGLRGQAVGNGEARSRRAGEISRGRAGLAGADQCGVAGGGGASGVALPGVEDGEDLNRSGNSGDQQVIWIDHRFSCAGNATGTAEIGVLDDPVRRVKGSTRPIASPHQHFDQQYRS